MYLILDTETTGFARFDLPHNHPAQPRIVSLGCVMLDSNLNENAEYYSLIKPEGFIIPASVVAIHGITTEEALSKGVPYIEAIEQVEKLARESSYHIFYNQQFDQKMLEIEAALRRPNQLIYTEGYRCVMEAMTPVCRIRKKTKPSEFKWPKLKEAYYHFFGEEPSSSHNALDDAKNTAAIVRELIVRGIWDVEKDVINEEKI